MEFSVRVLRKLVLPIATVSIIIGSAIALSLFTHTFPSVPTSTPPVLTTICESLTFLPSSVEEGSSGFIRGQCPNDAPAFTISSSGGLATPTFTLPTGYTRLGILSHTVVPPGYIGITCNLQPPDPFEVILHSGQPVNFSANASNPDLDYCVEYANAPVDPLPSFTVTWSQ